MQTVFLKLAKCFVALFAGWTAAAVPIAVPALLNPPGDIAGEALLFFFLLTGALAVPCWLLIAVPLFVCLPLRAKFWRYYMSILFCSVFGLLISFAFAIALYAGPASGEGTGILLLTLSGTASGATTFGVMSWMNKRNHKKGDEMARPNLATEPAR
jgi:hypothetical protein